MATGVDGRVNAELLHAELAFLLSRADVRVLHIKGPTVATWLYPEGGRTWGDVDVLVPPRRIDASLAVLAAHGFEERYPGVNHRTTTDHAVTVERPVTSPAAGEIDVHLRFPGITLDPGTAFDVLWARRVPGELAHTPVHLPDLSSRAVLVALNTGRTPESAKAREDLRRLATDDGVDWHDVIALAGELGALPAVRAALELEEPGREVISRTALATVSASVEWQLRTGQSGMTAWRLDELRRMPLRAALPAVGRLLVPHPAVIRWRDPRARAGGGALLLGYVRRLRDGLRAVPSAVRQVRGLRR